MYNRKVDYEFLIMVASYFLHKQSRAFLNGRSLALKRSKVKVTIY